MNKKGKVEVHTTDNRSWTSCGRVVSDREPSTKCFDHALHMAKTWCPCGTDALVNVSVFCASLSLEFGGKTMAGILNAMGHKTTRPV